MTLYTGGEAWLGTSGYAAPEQLNASEIDLDERVDVSLSEPFSIILSRA
ncbi:MAG: hypothetical protein ACJAVK_001037 [Akkermansiaceae bacterium]|jgi:hypothetical protein